jgi:transposase
MTTRIDGLVADALWALVEPLLPARALTERRPASCGSHPHLLGCDVSCPDLHAVAAAAARELGCGSPATVWRRVNGLFAMKRGSVWCRR